MKVLVVGGGAREHALAWRIAQDDDVEVICAPGNAGMAAFARCIPTGASDVPALVELVRQEHVGHVVVGPEAPLVDGLVDELAELGVEAFGPSKAAAQLEGSKIFSKEFMARHGIPTAAFRVFDDPGSAEAYVRSEQRPLVVKADGLAAGKGVFVAKDADEAVAGIDRIMREKAFGASGDRVLIEDTLVGQEVSYHVVADGDGYVAMAPAQDHKRAFDGDLGPNTGGMGAYSPPPVVTPEVEAKILAQVVEPTLAGMKAEGMPYRGALFVGVMVVEGEPVVLEYNVRFGDPECETLMTRWRGPVLPLFLGSARGDFAGLEAEWEAPCSMCVVLASGGYPGAYDKGKVIRGLTKAGRVEGVTIFHAGTRKEGGDFVTSGGRVLTVTAIGDDIDQCAARAYEAADLIEFEGKQLRRDIGHRARGAQAGRLPGTAQ